jgi:hypothetical protein
MDSTTTTTLQQEQHALMACCLLDDDECVLQDDLMTRFKILSKRNDENNDVLTHPIMTQLQEHLPLSKRGESFWLQYSLVQDGASIPLLLSKIREFDTTVLAIETVDGEVFGAFCTQAWKVAPDWYGNGEGFLWKLRQSRSSTSTTSTGTSATTTTRITPDDEQREVETIEHYDYEKNTHDGDEDEDELVQVFKFAFQNRNIQQCHNDRIMIGGGTRDSESKWGYGISLDQDLLKGSTSPCLTFASPSLSGTHSDGSRFEVRNLEVWVLTPCVSVEEAERSQDRKRLLLANSNSNSYFKPRAVSLSQNNSVNSINNNSNNNNSNNNNSNTKR